MEDIRQLCKRVIIINLGDVIYDGSLDELIKKYANYKNLKIIFNKKGIRKNQLRDFGEITEFGDYSCIIKVSNDHSKQTAIKLLSSDLPIEDVLISEDSIDDVIRKIFISDESSTSLH